MPEEPVHYEVFIRRNVQSGWALEFATENRVQAVLNAKEALEQGRAIGVKVTKEIRRASGEYQSLVIYSQGDLEPPRKKGRVEEDRAAAQLCVSPTDLYTIHARERIGRLLEAWLTRNNVCPFELVHRPDLVERLEATGLELQHAMQKVAIPEAQALGVSTHEVIRRYQKLVESAIARLRADARRKLFPDLAKDGLGHALEAAQASGAPAYVLGVAVAAALAEERGWAAKVARLLDIAEAAPDGEASEVLFQVLEQPLAEILGGRLVLAQLLGAPADLGRGLALILRMISPKAVSALEKSDPALAQAVPAVTPEVERLARWLAHPGFGPVRAALGRRVLSELQGARRLHPASPEDEIQTLRCLARLLIMSPQISATEDVHAVFVTRSRMLVSADFVQSYVEQCSGGAFAEAQALVRLAENVVGASNKRAAANWLKSAVGALRFEREFVAGADSPAQRLARLAELQQAVGRVGLEAEDSAEIAAKLGQVGDAVEAPARLIQAVAKSSGGALQRVTLLLGLASGDVAPLGPVSRRAKLEIARMMRDPAVRADLAHGRADEVERVRLMLQTAGMAA